MMDDAQNADSLARWLHYCPSRAHVSTPVAHLGHSSTFPPGIMS